MNALAMTSAPTRRNHWRRRLLLSAGALILLLAVGIPGCSWYQDYRFNQLLSQWRAMGEPDDIASWLASQPCDLELARAWQEWLDSDETTRLLDTWEDWFLPRNEFLGFDGILVDATDISASDRASLADGLALLQQPGLDITASARCWLRQVDQPDWQNHPNPLDTINQVQPFLSVRTLAPYLAWQSTFGKNAEMLDLLDHLVEASSEADLRLGMYLHITIADARDRAYLTNVVEGRIDAGGAQGWIADWEARTPLLHQVLRRESACLTVPAARAAHGDHSVSGPAPTAFSPPDPVDLLSAMVDGSFFSHGPSTWIADAIEAERILAQPSALRDHLADWDLIAVNSFKTILRHDAVARARRLASLLHLHWQSQRDLPPDTASLPAGSEALIQPGDPQQPTLRYERFSPTAFRIDIDPQAQGFLPSKIAAPIELVIDTETAPDDDR